MVPVASGAVSGGSESRFRFLVIFRLSLKTVGGQHRNTKAATLPPPVSLCTFRVARASIFELFVRALGRNEQRSRAEHPDMED
jgi:hypothetical protein